MTISKRALLSVSDKTGLVPFAQTLCQLGYEILSTGGTARLLKEHGVAHQEVSDYIGFPEIMEGRVKTLHPKIHGGILARGAQDDAILAKLDIARFDLVVVNLYPFQQVIARCDATVSEIVEHIDIGGPTLLRAAAKNFNYVSVVVDPADYPSVGEALATELSLPRRQQLASKAFRLMAEYDIAIANYFTANLDAKTTELPEQLFFRFNKRQDCRYGENPHQQAAVYGEAVSEQLQGKALSYNNLVDAEAAFNTVRGFSEIACVIVKHANPCGVAIAEDLLTAYQRAFATDKTSAFGGIIAFNEVLDGDTAQVIIDQQFVEVIIAPDISEAAKIILATKKNVRVLRCPLDGPQVDLDLKLISGGVLVQQRDHKKITMAECQVVSERQPTAQELEDCHFAWQVVKAVKSNAIVYGRDGQTVGIGAGQMSRVHSAQMGLIKAGEAELLDREQHLVMASDAFFPFRDSIDAAAKAGVTVIIQPGGSIRDQEVIDAANEAGIAMIFTGVRHFYH